MQRLYKSRTPRGRRWATIKRADAEAIQIKRPRIEENADNKESRCRGYTNQCKSWARRWRRRATIKRADAETIQIKGPQREEKSNNKESACRGYTNQVPAEAAGGPQ